MCTRLLWLLLCLSALLCGCGKEPSETTFPTQIPTETTIAATTPVETTLPAETIPPTTLPPETVPAPTVPPCELYIPGVSVEDVINYFNEVCLAAEFIQAGNPSVVQKWMSPICYTLHGPYTEEDYAVLTSFAAQLNEIPGFPGIYEATDSDTSNLSIHFCTQEEMVSIMGDTFWGMDGAVTFWYTADVIYDSTICYRTDIDQDLRNSVILEEIYNGLGPVQDTILRSDSIIYSAFSQPKHLTDIDWLLLKLLYHPAMQPGMDEAQCEAVIRQLYYENP